SISWPLLNCVTKYGLLRSQTGAMAFAAARYWSATTVSLSFVVEGERAGACAVGAALPRPVFLRRGHAGFTCTVKHDDQKRSPFLSRLRFAHLNWFWSRRSSPEQVVIEGLV